MGKEGDYTPTATLSSPECLLHQIKTGSDEGDFNVSLIVRDKVTNKTSVHRQRERRAEADSNRGLSDYQPNC